MKSVSANPAVWNQSPAPSTKFKPTGAGRMAVAVGHHAAMQFGDGGTARLGEGGGQKGMDQAGVSGQDHPKPEARGNAHVLHVGFVDGTGMAGKKLEHDAAKRSYVLSFLEKMCSTPKTRFFDASSMFAMERIKHTTALPLT